MEWIATLPSLLSYFKRYVAGYIVYDMAANPPSLNVATSLSGPLRGLPVDTPQGVLHFKSDCSLLDEETVLATARLAASGVFADFRVVVTPQGEEGAANAVRVNDRVLMSEGYPRTADLLREAGYRVVALATREIAKIDAGLSCMSLRWRA